MLRFQILIRSYFIFLTKSWYHLFSDEVLKILQDLIKTLLRFQILTKSYYTNLIRHRFHLEVFRILQDRFSFSEISLQLRFTSFSNNCHWSPLSIDCSCLRISQHYRHQTTAIIPRSELLLWNSWHDPDLKPIKHWSLSSLRPVMKRFFLSVNMQRSMKCGI